MEQEFQVSFQELIRGIEEEYGGRLVRSDLVSQEELECADIVSIKVGAEREDGFFIIFDRYERKINNMCAAYEVYRIPALERYGSLVISHNLE